MAEADKSEKSSSLVPMIAGDFISVLVLGGVVGLLVWGVGLLFNSFIFDNLLCQGDGGGQCESAKNYAAIAGLIIGGVAGLAGLIKVRVYRPLLVLIATAIGTWGLAQMSWGMTWYIGALVMIALFALAFGAFSWLTRIREFWISLVVVIILVAIVRFVLAG